MEAGGSFSPRLGRVEEGGTFSPRMGQVEERTFSPRMGRVEAGGSFSPRMGRVEAGGSFSHKLGRVEEGGTFSPRMGQVCWSCNKMATSAKWDVVLCSTLAPGSRSALMTGPVDWYSMAWTVCLPSVSSRYSR